MKAWITPYLKPKFFLFSAGILICLVSLVLNIRFAERMQQLQDNDIKYRYLLMKGKADGNSLDLLEINFSRKRDNSFIRHLTDTVTDFEYRVGACKTVGRTSQTVKKGSG